MLWTRWRPLAGGALTRGVAVGGRGGPHSLVIPGSAAQGHAHSPGYTMKSVKKESRLRIPASRFLEAAELIKGWRWLPWELRRTRQGLGFLDGIHDTGPGGRG